MNPSRPTVFQAGSPGLLPLSALLVLVCLLAAPAHAADDFETFLKPLWAQHCLKCHGEDKVKGKVNLKEILSVDQFLKQPGLIKEMVEVIDAYDMPPEEEPKLDENDRARLLATLTQLLRDATGNASRQQVRIRRLNRFQYNNAIRDLFQLNRDVFRLPEKMMTRRTAYLHPPAATLPDSVEATCGSLNKDGGLREVNPFPKDLRAAHGFDNQANQLTLSPLLLDTFLKLSVSIMESPDFNADTVGVWNEFFMAPPADADMAAEVSARLKPFLSKAFRRSIDEGTLDRYATYTLRKIEEGLSFAESMKKVSSATLVSPLFLYRYTAADNGESPYNLAANLSFFLWGSGPDEALLERAESGELATPETLDATIDRMLADPKIERFLDTFPAQWMQLENILAATPDPARHRLFSLDKNNPASMHMVLEPLLLFDAVFLEDRPVIELVSPTFGYQSKFLQDWYNTPLKPEPIDEAAVAAENKARGDKRKSLETGLQKIRAELAELDKALADPIATKWTDVDLTPGQTQWETAQARRVADSVVLSTWHRLGPFGAESLPKAHRKPFINETDVDLTAVHGDQKWTAAEAYVDGKVHTLEGANCATYLYRTLEAGRWRSGK